MNTRHSSPIPLCIVHCALCILLAALAAKSAFAFEPGRENLTIGVLSDVHVGTGRATTLEKAFTFFRDAKVDGVIIAGDIANGGHSNELKSAGNAWDAVFPGDKAPDGRLVEKIFLYGNHDYFGKSINRDPAGAWRYAFHEDWAPIYAKTVKGYVFICAHWGHEKKLADFLRENEEELHLRDGRPFFYSQHPHPGDTVYGPWAWGNDKGVATAALNSYSNAVAFSGHSHHSLTDERGIWQGAFTSVGTSSLSYIYAQYWRENGESTGGEPPKQMPLLREGDGKQGMVMRVYDEAIVLERWDLVAQEKVGDDWVVPLDGTRPFAFAPRRAAAIPPEFPRGAGVSVTNLVGTARGGKTTDQVVVSFPAATPSPTSRVHDYEVQALAFHEDKDYPVATKRVHAAKFFLPVAREAATNRCVFAFSELPEHETLVFAVRPVECFGRKGHEILSAPWRRPAPDPAPTTDGAK